METLKPYTTTLVLGILPKLYLGDMYEMVTVDNPPPDYLDHICDWCAFVKMLGCQSEIGIRCFGDEQNRGYVWRKQMKRNPIVEHKRMLYELMKSADISDCSHCDLVDECLSEPPNVCTSEPGVYLKRLQEPESMKPVLITHSLTEPKPDIYLIDGLNFTYAGNGGCNACYFHQKGKGGCPSPTRTIHRCSDHGTKTNSGPYFHPVTVEPTLIIDGIEYEHVDGLGCNACALLTKCPYMSSPSVPCKDTTATTGKNYQIVINSMESKDLARIRDIQTKAGGSRSKEISLAVTMANLITHADKAEGRAEAARIVFGDSHPVTAVFVKRYLELTGTPSPRYIAPLSMPVPEPVKRKRSQPIPPRIEVFDDEFEETAIVKANFKSKVPAVPSAPIKIQHEEIICKLTYEKDAQCVNCHFHKYTMNCMSMTDNQCEKYPDHIWKPI